jgi:hypothetical protein
LSSTFFSDLFSGVAGVGSVPPDPYDEEDGVPPDSFVMCRDRDGNATAVYGDDVWDFNPYRLSANRVNLFRFDGMLDGEGVERRRLINEVKYIFFCLIFYVSAGHIGRLSPSSLLQYYTVLRSAVRYCYAQRDREMVGVLSLQQLFTIPVYLAAFLRECKMCQSKVKKLRALLRHLVSVGEKRLGYRIQGVFDVDFGLEGYREGLQHPVIPTRIYLEIINILGDRVDQIFSGIDSLEEFIASFEDRVYGTSINFQRCTMKVSKRDVRPIFEEAIAQHQLNSVFAGDFICKERMGLSLALAKVQYIIKTIIHTYTGMRDQEVARLPYNCLSQSVVVPDTTDSRGVVRDRARMVDLISTTTKFEGYRQVEAWLATEDVIKAVKVGQAICRGLSKIYKTDVNDMPLFLNPSIIVRKGDIEVGVTIWRVEAKPESLATSILIEQSDLAELAATDPGRDFSAENSFAVGMPWNLTSHQFRRSLAFYGSSSGFISLPSLKKQYKHMTLQMARYYANNFENLKTIFGYYDSEKKEFVLPQNHMAYEFQMGMPMSVAYDILTEVLGENIPLFGGVGSYINKQRQRLESGEAQIADVRAETMKRVANGHLRYRPTLLGGCTKVGECDSYLLGDFTTCLSCEGSIIKPQKLDEAIKDAERELAVYEEGSGEYQITKGDWDRLVRYRHRLINVMEVE